MDKAARLKELLEKRDVLLDFNSALDASEASGLNLTLLRKFREIIDELRERAPATEQEDWFLRKDEVRIERALASIQQRELPDALLKDLSGAEQVDMLIRFLLRRVN